MADPPSPPLRAVGVDLASQATRSSLCVIEWDTRPRVVELRRPADDDLVVDRASTTTAVGLDCPLGWPTAFVEVVRRHHDGHPTGVADAPPRDLRLRTCDQWIRAHHVPRDPLSVSTDRLGIVALRGIGILERLAGPGAPRCGAAGIYEAYPAGSLAVWGIPSTGYKRSSGDGGRAVRRGIVDRLADHVDLGDRAEQLVTDDDDLDAVITALVAGLAHLGLTTTAPPEHAAVARIEGWIHVPVVGLDALPDLSSA